MTKTIRYAALAALAVGYWTLVYIAHGQPLMSGFIPGMADVLYLAAGTCMFLFGWIQRS